MRVDAKPGKKNLPKSFEVENALESAGGTHNPKKMDVEKAGSLVLSDTYFHVFRGTLKSGEVRAIVFDNSDRYLGYYSIERIKFGSVTKDSFALLDGSGYYFVKLELPLPKTLQTRAGKSVCTFIEAPELPGE